MPAGCQVMRWLLVTRIVLSGGFTGKTVNQWPQCDGEREGTIPEKAARHGFPAEVGLVIESE